ncbi:DedA family protein [Catenuloplanes atrovinosus]|uniref:Membrane protein DedA with SNARE-associated domain n=1 Tax=Catenuloplanes atrovinosus TaxID=137266 RepID=A0AAE3YK28_9ACTN|nr:VTT domain-containing protein [Catenuloplanes atrovinosus]MDR7273736.1 membrane protein DedA with SNARE-associated domain [Catenuloplanes atrovinosus]
MTLGLGGLASLFCAVAFGAVLPIVPTGAAVGGAAALAAHGNPVMVLFVVLTGALGAYLGDLVTYAACRWGGEALARRMRWLRGNERLDRLGAELKSREVPVLLVSRLLPGGRIPMLLAASVIGVTWRTFLYANAPACALWSAVYTGVGLLGGTVFPRPWEGVVAAIVLVVVVTQVAGWVHRRREASA